MDIPKEVIEEYRFCIACQTFHHDSAFPGMRAERCRESQDKAEAMRRHRQQMREIETQRKIERNRWK